MGCRALLVYVDVFSGKRDMLLGLLLSVELVGLAFEPGAYWSKHK